MNPGYGRDQRARGGDDVPRGDGFALGGVGKSKIEAAHGGRLAHHESDIVFVGREGTVASTIGRIFTWLSFLMNETESIDLPDRR